MTVSMEASVRFLIALGAAVLILLTYIFVEISSVLYLGALVLNELMGIPVMASVIVLAAGIGLYTIIVGLRAVIWTEMFQLGVLLLGGIARNQGHRVPVRIPGRGVLLVPAGV